MWLSTLGLSVLAEGDYVGDAVLEVGYSWGLERYHFIKILNLVRLALLVYS